MNNKVTRLFLAIAAIAGLLGSSIPSDAGLTGATCTGGKIKATGKKAKAKLTCHATGAKLGLVTSASCLTTAETKFSGSFANAEAKPPCFAVGDDPAIEAKVDTFVSDIVTDLRPALTESKCAQGQLNAAGKKASSKLTCHQKAAKKGLSVDPLCLTKAEDKFDDKYASAIDKGDCLSASTAATIEAVVDAFIADVVDDLRPPPVSRCTGFKLTETGKKAQLKSRCHSIAVENGVAVDPACLVKAETGFDDGFLKAESFTDCLMPTGDAAALEAIVDDFISDLDSALRPTATASTCNGTKFEDAGLESFQKLRCRGNAIRFQLPAAVGCLDPADVDFAKAESKGDCLTLTDEAAIETLIDGFISDAVTALVP